MKLRVLGSAGGESRDYRATSLLINDRLLVDAGSVMQSLDLERQRTTNYALVTHAHLDHIKDLGFLVDNTFGRRDAPFRIMAPPPVIRDLQTHIFNWVIWPDFSALPTPDNAVLRWAPFDASIEVEGLRIEAREVNHPGHAYGYLIEDLQEDLSIVVTGDTSSTDDIWDLAFSHDNLVAIFVDVAFPNRMQDIAQQAGHFTPQCFAEEMTKFPRTDLPIYIYHIKPVFHFEVIADIAALGCSNLHPIADGDEFTFLPRRLPRRRRR